VHILSWLESNGCLDVFESESIWGPAIEEGHLHVLDWMNSHRLFSDGEGDWMLEVAVECGSDRDVLDWLHKHFKLNFTRSFHRAAEVEKIEMIKWMISKGQCLFIGFLQISKLTFFLHRYNHRECWAVFQKGELRGLQLCR